MKICMIGKYPPLQGGVSRQMFWIAYALAQAGHQVWVVTNAFEDFQDYKIHLDCGDHAMLERDFASGGFVRVIKTTSQSQEAFIPYANPFVSKLTSLATDVVKKHQCDLIFGYYLEPYGVAAALVSAWTGVPYVIQHAGSDISRLLDFSDLRTTYKHVLQNASAVLTTHRLKAKILNLGVKEDCVVTERYGSALPTMLFQPQGPKLDIAAHLNDYLKTTKDPHPIYSRSQQNSFDPNTITFGHYGKIHEKKGTFDLLDALQNLKNQNLKFQLLLLNAGRECDFDFLFTEIQKRNLQDVAWCLPLLPHWRVPQFLRLCDAVCFLERDFGIANHNPIVAREVLACGRALILSQEIFQKQKHQNLWQDQNNFYLVKDPSHPNELASVLKNIITDFDNAIAVAHAGHKLSQTLENFSDFVFRVNVIFSKILDKTIRPNLARKTKAQT